MIGHIGRFTKPKNHKFLIDLFFEYHKNARNSKLLLVGDGELFDSIKQQVERLGIDEDVLMVGGKSDTETYYQAMDVFVFPSLWEGLGIVEIEAQANGLYCLVSKNIPMEAVLVESTKVLSLQNIYEWLIELNNIQVGTRNMTVSKRMQQYNIQTISKEFQEFYIEQCRCSR